MIISNHSNDLVEDSHVLQICGVSSTKGEEQSLDRQQLVKMEQRQAAWNATRQDFLQNACVPELVAAQAAATPDAVALVANSQVLSYGELNRRANQLANYLRGRGLQSEALVGVCINTVPVRI